MIHIMSTIANIFQAMIVYQFVDRTLKRKKSHMVVMSCWMLGMLVSEIYAQLTNIILYNMIITISVISFLCIFLYQNEFKRKLIIVIYIESFMMISEVIANVILMNTTGNTNEDEYFLIGSIISKMLFFLFVSIVILMGIKKENIKIDTKTWWGIILVPVCSMFMILIFHNNDNELGMEDLFFYISALLINYIAVVQYLNLQRMAYLDSKNKELARESKYYLNQCELTNNMLENIKIIKHDIKNEYIVDRKLLNDKMYKELDERYAKKLEEMYSYKMYVQTGNVYIDAIINYKAMEITNLGGNFICKIDKFDSEKIDNNDVIVILGNLLDNVIDALSNDELKDRECQLKLIYDKPNLIINIRNNYIGKRKCNGKGVYFTTKQDDKFHGMGLRSIKNVLEKYDGVMEIKDEGGIFLVSVYMCEQ